MSRRSSRRRAVVRLTSHKTNEKGGSQGRRRKRSSSRIASDWRVSAALYAAGLGALLIFQGMDALLVGLVRRQAKRLRAVGSKRRDIAFQLFGERFMGGDFRPLCFFGMKMFSSKQGAG